MTFISLASEQLSCTINPLGAELHRLTGKDGREWLWDGDAAYWSGRAPILFPIVGMLANGEYRWQGKSYPLEKHGFARRRCFTVIEQGRAALTLRLSADDATRRVYPFDFELDLRFALAADLVISASVRNFGDGPMPFSFGFHPALRWPQRAGAQLIFDEPEVGPVWRINEAGLLSGNEALPGDGRTLSLNDALFADDAMILRNVASRGINFTSGDQRIRIAWDNFPDLGLWTKPGAPFLCIEPWAGYNDPAGFTGDFADKPGIMMLAPGSSWTASLSIGSA